MDETRPGIKAAASFLIFQVLLQKVIRVTRATTPADGILLTNSILLGTVDINSTNKKSKNRFLNLKKYVYFDRESEGEAST